MKKNPPGRFSMPFLTIGAAMALILCTASCASNDSSRGYGMARSSSADPAYKGSRQLPMEPTRKVSEQDCRQSFYTDGGNLRCI
jgi:hypothetical protein